MLRTQSEGVLPILETMVDVSRVDELATGHYRIIPTGGQSILGSVSEMAKTNNWVIAELTVEPGRLDDVFRRLTTETGQAEAA